MLKHKLVEEIKFYHNRIFAFSLLGKLSLSRGDIGSAVKDSTKAVEYLQKMGTIPLIRMEEVFFNHYCILKATQEYQSQARHWLNQAHMILQHKADSLEDEEYKRTFLERVLLSREILSKCRIESIC